MRSFLTTLGIIIGVAAVIAMVAIGEGAKARVEDAFASMGTNLLIVLPGTTTRGGARGGFGSMPTLTWDDLAAIRAEVPAVRAAAPSSAPPRRSSPRTRTGRPASPARRPSTSRSATGPSARARSSPQSDVDGGTKVGVLGQTVVDKLFGAGADPVGQTVRIKNIPFQVVGVLARKGQSPMGQDYDDAVFMPAVDRSRRRSRAACRSTSPGSIIVGAPARPDRARRAPDHATCCATATTSPPGGDDDFSIRNLHRDRGRAAAGRHAR